jgi:hypothetical protein
MGDDELVYEPRLAVRERSAPARPRLVVITAVFTAIMAAATCVVAILAPAPAVVTPLIAAICVGCPVFAGWEVPSALSALRANRGEQALARLRRKLAELPEIEHPLGF